MLRIARFLTFFAGLTLLAAAQQRSGFQVIKAEYGADNTWVDLTAKLQGMIRGEGLEFRVDGETLGDPLPGVQKTLRVRYVWRGRMQTDNFPDLAQVRLGNPSGFGGVRPGGNPPGNSGIFGGNRQGRELTIVRAEYGTGNRWMDVTNLLAGQINGSSLRLTVNNQTMGGDPAPANPKSLRVTYSWRGAERLVTVPENSDLQLPETGAPSGGYDNRGNGPFGRPGYNRLTIVSATYGEGNRRRDVRPLLENQLRGDRLSLLVANDTLGGDPAPAARKTLQVVYALNNQQFAVELPEGAQLSIPNSNDRPASGAIFNSGGAYNGSYGNSTLQILSADYGAQGRRNNVTDLLARAVQGDRLNLRITNQSMGGDPYPGPDKELYVRYSYQGQTYETYVREGATLSLPNSSDRSIGSSGGATGSIFGGYSGGNDLYIESATWGAPNRSADVTADVRAKLSGGKLNVKASNSSFRIPDPAVGDDKDLIVVYRIGNGPRQTARAREGQFINLP